jgi:hypothetical protein
MAVPTFTSVSPTTGSAGGRNMVTITGTNFRVPGDVEDVVKVEFDGIELTRVDIMSATELRVVVPAFTGIGTAASADPLAAVDIVITNLDDNGVAIVGENVTESDAYTYTRTPIRDPNATQVNQIYRQIIYEMLRTFQRQLLTNVAIGTDVDYGSLGEIVPLTAKVPAISIIGPRIGENMETRHMWADFDEGTGQPADVYWPNYVANFEFDFVLATDKKREVFGMSQGLIDLFLRTPYLRVPSTVDDYTSTMHRFPFALITAPSTTISKPNSNLISAPGVFEIRDIPYRLDDNIDITYEVLEGNLLFNQLGTSEANEETVTFADED